MKRFCLWLVLTMICMSTEAQATLNVMTFNIRLNVPSDGYNAWPNRKELVRDMIRFHEVDVLGVQEALPGQMTDLQKLLPEFTPHGIARDTSDWGEFSAIWYRKARLNLVKGNTFWLAPKPDSMGKGWDAALNRIATWALFEDRDGGTRFFVLNTHFDHRGELARTESARLIRTQIQKLNPDGLPVIVMGDFNATPEDKPYEVMTDAEFGLFDARKRSIKPPFGPKGTWSGFKFPGDPDRQIDFIFVNDKVAVLSHATLTNAWSGRFPSDHIPVWAQVQLFPVKPLPQGHSHNDYEHDRPLLDALQAGFGSVEADIWFVDGKWLVKHDKPGNPNKTPTLEELYLRPLAQLIQQQGCIYPADPQQKLWLMLDLKQDGVDNYQALLSFLSPYNWMFEEQNAPIRLFLSGGRPMAHMLENPTTGVGIDGRPEHLGQNISAEHMPVISQRYGKLFSWKGRGEIPEKERLKLKQLVEDVHTEGKKLRLWATPETETLWKVFLEEGVDFINTDELQRLNSFIKMNRN